jgi:hypothetical protein
MDMEHQTNGQLWNEVDLISRVLQNPQFTVDLSEYLPTSEYLMVVSESLSSEASFSDLEVLIFSC